MAAATVVKRVHSVFGNQRAEMANVTVNNVGDTYTGSSMKSVSAWHVEAGGSNAIGATISGNVLTFAGTTGAANVLMIGT